MLSHTLLLLQEVREKLFLLALKKQRDDVEKLICFHIFTSQVHPHSPNTYNTISSRLGMCECHHAYVSVGKKKKNFCCCCWLLYTVVLRVHRFVSCRFRISFNFPLFSFGFHCWLEVGRFWKHSQPRQQQQQNTQQLGKNRKKNLPEIKCLRHITEQLCCGNSLKSQQRKRIVYFQ